MDLSVALAEVIAIPYVPRIRLRNLNDGPRRRQNRKGTAKIFQTPTKEHTIKYFWEIHKIFRDQSPLCLFTHTGSVLASLHFTSLTRPGISELGRTSLNAEGTNMDSLSGLLVKEFGRPE